MGHTKPGNAFFRAAVGILAVVAVIWLLQTAEAVLAPVVLALVFGVVSAPLTDVVDRWMPRALSAFLVLLLSLAALLAILMGLAPVIEDGLAVAPVLEQELRNLLAAFRPAMDNLGEIRSSLQDTLNNGTHRSEAGGGGVEVPSPLDALWYAPGFISQLLIFVGTLYFFLLSRHEVYRAIHRDGTPLDAAALAQAEARVSRYFLTITAINAAFGAIVAIAMTLIGMPVPVVWGLAAFFVNFILYLGPMVFALFLLVAGLTVFDGLYSLLPALTYVALNATEGQFLTPALVGKRLAINPLMVFVSLVFWLWLWGPLGGIIAIPLLLWGMKIHEVLAGADARLQSVSISPRT